jgi:hypothetical protein
MRKWVWILLLSLVLFFPGVARGQDKLALSSVEINLWPEYDHPGVLVIYRLTLPSQSTMPVELTVRIPAASGEPNAVASIQTDGTLLNINYTRQVSGNWASINTTITPPAIGVQLEYYDPALEKNGDARHYEYAWQGDYASDSMIIQVQEPLGATNMRISPSLGDGLVGNDGLTYFTQEVGPVSAGQTVTVVVDYNKATDELTAPNLEVQPSGPITEDTTFSVRFLQVLPWILGVLGAVLIVGGIYWYWRTGRRRESAPKRRRRTSSEPRESSAAEEQAGDIYCHQCGNRAAPGDRFCRSCGTRLRIE